MRELQKKHRDHRRRPRQGPDDRRSSWCAIVRRRSAPSRSGTRSCRRCSGAGVLVLGAGKNAVRLAPPLVLTQDAGRQRARRAGRGAGGGGGVRSRPESVRLRRSGLRTPSVLARGLHLAPAVRHDRRTAAAGKCRRRSAPSRNSSAAGTQFLRAATARRHGEIDIVARDGDTTVFVEVKARATAEFGTAAEAVTTAEAAPARVDGRGLSRAQRLTDRAVPIRRRGDRWRGGVGRVSPSIRTLSTRSRGRSAPCRSGARVVL